ncbi:hypothetical protein ABEF93_005108 [Exophiala dermatitidis]
MLLHLPLPLNALVVFYLTIASSVSAALADQSNLKGVNNEPSKRRGYSRGEPVPVSCLNRTIETGEHITDAHGNLQYIPFPTCNETNQPLSFLYNTPQTQTCTIDALPDELYHLFEFFVHSDVPLTCRVPSYPLEDSEQGTSPISGATEAEKSLSWTPFTIALQGTLQLSHLHLHTNINVLFHMSQQDSASSSTDNELSHLIASTAYSVPNTSSSSATPVEGTKILRNEPVVLTFNVGWIDGAVLPGMVGRPVLGVRDHSVGFSLLSFFALSASAGVGAMAMLIYERRKSGRSGMYGNGILGGNVGNGGVVRSSGYGGYGGYSSIAGKRD